MSLENILNNDETKIIFLKAIMLGINYGKSDKINYYIDNIEKEIKKINIKKDIYNNSLENNTFDNTIVSTSGNISGNTLGNSSINLSMNTSGNTPINTSGNTLGNTSGNTLGNISNNNFTNNRLISNKLNDNKEIIDNSLENINIKKFEKNISFLESQKIYTFNLIQKLSSQNYSFNYSRINLLKSNFIVITNEIEKNKLLIKKNKEKIINKF